MATHRRAGGAGHGAQRSARPWRVLSALFLLAMGAIHLYLVFQWASGLIGVLFVLNAIGGFVLALAILVAPRRFLPVASVLGLLLMVGTLLGLVLALTVGIFGVREQIGSELVVPTLVDESLGAVVLAVTTAVAVRARDLA